MKKKYFNCLWNILNAFHPLAQSILFHVQHSALGSREFFIYTITDCSRHVTILSWASLTSEERDLLTYYQWGPWCLHCISFQCSWYLFSNLPQIDWLTLTEAKSSQVLRNTRNIRMPPEFLNLLIKASWKGVHFVSRLPPVPFGTGCVTGRMHTMIILHCNVHYWTFI